MKKYDVQMQMRQWSNIITWIPQAIIEAADDAEAIQVFEARDDWSRFDNMMVGDAARLVRRQGDGPQVVEVVASRGKPVISDQQKRRNRRRKRAAGDR